MGTTFRGVIFKHHKKSDGTIRAKIRITHNCVVKYIPTAIVFFPDQYTKAFKMKECTAKWQLDDLSRKYTEMLATKDRTEDYSIDQIIAYVTKSTDHRIDFIAFWKSRIESIPNKGTKKLYNTSLNALKTFCGGVLYTDDITRRFVERYTADIASHTKGRAVSLYIGHFSKIFKEAKREFNDEDFGIIKIPNNPFEGLKLPKQEPTRKRALSLSTIRLISRAELTGRAELARDVAIMSFHLLGMNTADFYHCKPSKNGRIEYERQKTRTRRDDKAFISIAIPEEVQHLIQKYKGKKNLFDFCERYSGPENFNQAVNKGLKMVGKRLGIDDLEFYAFRHSWATIAIDRGANKYAVHEGLNHVAPDMKVTDIYIKKNWALLDKTNRIVIDALHRTRHIKRFIWR